MTFDAATLAAYATHARAYADDWLSQPPPTDLQATITRWFLKGDAGGITGDIGCGSGREVDWLERHGYPAIGFDASAALLAEARARFPDYRFEHAELPALESIAPRTFDNVLCETVLMHLPHDAIAASVSALRRILRPRGTLYLSWRVSEADQRDDRGRLYTAFAPGLVLDRLDGMDVVHSQEATSASSGKRIHAVVARDTRQER
jgi:SAM-dependent methyltransferase